jgi:hypothetical protein
MDATTARAKENDAIGLCCNGEEAAEAQARDCSGGGSSNG